MAERNWRRYRFRLIVFGLLCLAVMVGIFFLSAQPAEDSAQQSRFFMETALGRWILESIPKLFSGTQEHQIRKLAHMFEYCCLAGTYLIFFDELLRCRPTRLKEAAIVSLFCCALYAGMDEIHQIFIPGRAGRLSDVLIDCLGGGVGILLVLSSLSVGRVVLKLYYKNRK